MIPDEPSMIEIAQDLEKKGAELGWDVPPVLGVIYRTPGVYHSTVLPIQPAAVPGITHPMDGLIAIADGLTANIELNRRQAQQHGLLGAGRALASVWLVFEGWGNNIPEEERDGRSLADVPGSVECRLVTMLDCAGRVYVVERKRGEAPRTQVVRPDEPDAAFGGNVILSLRRILLALGANMPQGSIDLAAVGRAGVQ